MKAHEIFELADKIAALKKTEDKPMNRSRRRASRFAKTPDEDIVTQLHKALERADTLKKVLDDREKANKKEKDKGPTAQSIATFLMMTYPIIALVLLYLLKR
jgi:hypothetical protein